MYLTLKLFKSTYLQGKQDGWSQNAPEQWRRKQAQTRTEVGSCAVLTGSKSTFLWQSQRWKQVKQSSRWLWQRLSAAEGAAFLPESTLCSPLSGGYHSSLYASASETSPKGTCSSLWVLHHLQAPCSLCFLCRKANNSENWCACVCEKHLIFLFWRPASGSGASAAGWSVMQNYEVVPLSLCPQWVLPEF